MDDFTNPSINDEIIRKQFWPGKKDGDGKLAGDTSSWSLKQARAALGRDYRILFRSLAYRPFDLREMVYSDVMLERPRTSLMLHIMERDNIALSMNRGVEEDRSFADVFVFDRAIQIHSLSIKEANNLAPLYAYPGREADQSDAFTSTHRTPNLDPALYAAICAAAGIDPASQAGPDDDFRAATGDARPSEVKLFDYLYGVLHSPDYRRTYAEFLKIDFPRIPYPPSPEVFAHVSGKGEALRRLHLMEPGAVGDAPYPFTGEGDDVVAAGYPKWAAQEGSGTPDRASQQSNTLLGSRVRGDERGVSDRGRVLINKDQGFDGVPAVAWAFPIGGYLPAQKWLKDRRGRALSWDDVGHYQRVVKVLAETDRIMREIVLPVPPSPASAGEGQPPQAAG